MTGAQHVQYVLRSSTGKSVHLSRRGKKQNSSLGLPPPKINKKIGVCCSHPKFSSLVCLFLHFDQAMETFQFSTEYKILCLQCHNSL